MASSSTIPPNPSAHNLAQLVPKLYDNDSDFRYMALNDIFSMLSISSEMILASDYSTSAKLIDGFLNTMNDTHGDVQNMAIRCLGPFVNRIPESILCPMIDKVSQLQTGNIVDNSIPALALRTMVVSLPRPQQGIAPTSGAREAYSAISRALMPRLVGYTVIPTGRKDLPPPPKGMLDLDLENGTDSNAIDVLTEVARCYGPLLQEVEISALQKTIFEILDSDRAGSVLKKKSVIAMSALSTYFSDGLLSKFVSKIIEILKQPHLPHNKRKLYVTMLGSMARSIPRKFGPYLKTLAPFVLTALSESELEDEMAQSTDLEDRDPEADEVREAALAALESFIACCVEDMRMYTAESIDAALRFLKYDPNLAGGEDDEMDADEDEDDELEGEDFEEETGFDDEDDASWKIRRSAAKVFSALIATRCHGINNLLEDGTLYEKIAPALIARFKEREESVRLEVLAALSLLIRNTVVYDSSEEIQPSSPTIMGPPSRKRRRGGSDASMFDNPSGAYLSNGFALPERSSTPATGPRASLSKLSPDIVRGIANLLKSSPMPTKQASIVLLKDLVKSRRGGLEDSLGSVIDPIVEAAKTQPGSFSGGSSSTSANTYRIQALQFLSAAVELHPSASLAPYLTKALPAVIAAAKDRYSKVSVEAISTIEQLVKSICPPRNANPSSTDRESIQQLYDALVNRVSANDADLEVRQQAINALGLLLGLTSGTDTLLSKTTRKEGLNIILERLKNELTRLASVRAIEAVAALAKNKDEFQSSWVQEAAVELGHQLRKASRTLRGASLSALRTLCTNPATGSHLDSTTIKELVGLILPVFRDAQVDLHMLGPALIILMVFVRVDAKSVVNQEFISNFCGLLRKEITGHALDALLALVTAIGQAGVGAPLMKSLLQDLGVGGNPDLTGKAIGSLLVAGPSTVGVKLDDFIKELNTAKDDKRRCLALSVLGEAGLRMATSSPLKPELFMQHFSSESETVPLTAAVALGRAGAGNVQHFLPVILSAAKANPKQSYLPLHSIREILQHTEAESDIIPYAKDMWDTLIVASEEEDNKAIGAECVGRLAVVDPKSYLPQLQTFLHDPKDSYRGMVISALRYTLADSDSSYDEYLKPIIIPMLTTMLNDSNLDNLRLALTTLNAASHNKPDLVLPHLTQLLPLAVKETVVRPELVREVKMGPFTHRVDDGLEIRKAAYQTLYSFLDNLPSNAATSIIPTIFDRTVAGLADEHDIRMLCLLMLSKLITLAPEETQARLETICAQFKTIIDIKPKENAVKQEIEKLNEAQRGVVKAGVMMSKRWIGDAGGMGQDAQIRAWESFWAGVRKGHAALLKAAEEEVKEKER
ncbi:cullin binding protein CanA [Rhizodiscina lignyota]|uniref:Cullin binding protein CanA n=1 Tax=Rhizodiscina lignyota TaxID=1504668 RepID=A0A9P4IRG4_9PEZI|nr:cullin binding protein CanA [Rhizodiscina lignyota]